MPNSNGATWAAGITAGIITILLVIWAGGCSLVPSGGVGTSGPPPESENSEEQSGEENTNAPVVLLEPSECGGTWNGAETINPHNGNNGRDSAAISDLTIYDRSDVELGVVSWIGNGPATEGWKLLWSKNANPQYEPEAGDKYCWFDGVRDRGAYKIDAFDGPGTYYVRVCEPQHYFLETYKCEAYSNQIQINL